MANITGFGGLIVPISKRMIRAFFYTLFILMTILGGGYFSVLSGLAKADDSGFGTVVEPEEYTIGPGDRFRIDFWSSSNPPLDVTVTPEGYLLLTAMGRVDIGNMTLIEARTKLRDLIAKFYSETEFSITLIGARPVKVLVAGAVKNPGLYDGLVSQRVSELIDKAGGFVEGASRRNIVLSGGSKSYDVDFLRYLREGDLDANPYLYSGYKIYVPPITDSSTFVHVSGEVINPGGFEYKEKDKLATIMKLAMGLTGLQGDSILIFRQRQIISFPIDKLDFDILPGDKIIIPKRPLPADGDYYSITGEVVMPGRFPFEKGMGLGQALRGSGNLTAKADIYSLVIYRKQSFVWESQTSKMLQSAIPNNLSFKEKAEPASISIADYYPDHLDEIKIMPCDSIVVPLLTGTVGVYGMVNRPGKVVFSGPRMNISELVGLAGGYAKGAGRGNADIIRKASGLKIRSGRHIDVFDGDIVIIPDNQGKGGFWQKLKDISLIAGSLGIVYLAVDKMAD